MPKQWASETYTRLELLYDVCRLSGLSRPKAKRAMEATLQAIQEALREGERVELRGFGAFRVKPRAQTKERMFKGKALFRGSLPQVHFKAARPFRLTLASKEPK